MKQNPYGFLVSEEKNTDPNLLSREVFNPYDCALVFQSLRHNEKELWATRECLPGKHRFLPHGYYRVEFACGFKGWAKSPFGGLNPKKKGIFIDVILNLGESIGKGLVGEADQLRKRFLHDCAN